MSELSKKLVTADFLKKFGDKCKLLFDQAPIQGSGAAVYLPGISDEYSKVFLQVEGYAVESNSTDNNSFLLFVEFINDPSFIEPKMQCFSLGTKTPTKIKFFSDFEEKTKNISVAFYWDNSDIPYTAQLQVNLACYKLENVSDLDNAYWERTFINGASIISFDAITSTSAYELPVDKINTSSSTPFTIIDIDEDELIYPGVTKFDSIKSSKYATQFSKKKTIQYGTSTDALETDFSEDTISLPLPSTFKLKIKDKAINTGGNYVSLNIQDGQIIGYNADSIPVATSNSLGGIKVQDTAFSQSDIYYVAVDGNQKAYVKVPAITSIQADLSKLTPSNKYLGKIYQHIGESDTKFTNGYFYKCSLQDSQWTLQGTENEDGTDFYRISGAFSRNVNAWINSGKLRRPSADEDFCYIYIDPTDVTYVKDIKKFAIVFYKTFSPQVNSPCNILTLSELNTLGISIDPDSLDELFSKKGDSFWYNSTNYTNGLLFRKAASGYTWYQWDTQPAVISSNENFYVITNPDIDNIINPIESIELSATELTINKTTPAVLTATALPTGSNQEFTWSVDIPAIANISSTTGNTITVYWQGVGEAVVTATSVYGNMSATCKITSK